MRATGALSGERADEALRRGLGLRPSGVYSDVRERPFFDHVRELLVRRYGEATVRRGGLRVYTTLDPRLQRLARKAIRSRLYRDDDPSAALVSIDPKTGAIRALVAETPGRRLQFNLAVDGRRQAGSTFKTFVLAEAIRRGANPYATRYASKRFDHNGWRPETYDGTEYGLSTLAEATLRSDNLVFAKLTLDLGPRYVAAMARALGVRSGLEAVPSIGLGSNEVTPLELASAYATLAAGGVYREPFAIRKVVLGGEREDGWGLPATAQGRVIPAGVAYEVSRLLAANVERGTGTAARLSRPAAGKTGTTDDHTDAWFAGYVPQLATAVWVGYPKRAARMLSVHGIRVSGGTFPAQIWGGYMEPAVARLREAPWLGANDTIEWLPWAGPRSLNARAGAAVAARAVSDRALLPDE
jgi:penicillin-binding protein 1A